MTYIGQAAGTRRRNPALDSFPEVKPSEIARLKRNCPNSDDISDFASGIRRKATRYQYVEDDYELVIIFLKEKRIEGLAENVNMIVPVAAYIGTSMIPNAPKVELIATGVSRHSIWLSKMISYIYEPDYIIPDRSREDSYVIPIPRDEATLGEMKTFFNDIEVPKPIGSGLVELFGKGVTMKTFLTGVSTVFTFFKPTATDASGLSEQEHMFAKR
jgi:hypothetical protein